LGARVLIGRMEGHNWFVSNARMQKDGNEMRKCGRMVSHGHCVAIGGGGYALFFAAAPPHTGGGVAAGPTQGSKYEQLWIGTYMPFVSLGLAQPFPISILTFDPDDWVNDGPGMVIIVPVGV